ncbi:MAG: hypothetical protein A2Z04_06675 [Chloroflexi bacterium RBG_16_57_9]|nr:MAG: hypothetical protein A2Z04_06675 [Chloroflexi bacterium RBG_16_57_9]
MTEPTLPYNPDEKPDQEETGDPAMEEPATYTVPGYQILDPEAQTALDFLQRQDRVRIPSTLFIMNWEQDFFDLKCRQVGSNPTAAQAL